MRGTMQDLLNEKDVVMQERAKSNTEHLNQAQFKKRRTCKILYKKNAILDRHDP